MALAGASHRCRSVDFPCEQPAAKLREHSRYIGQRLSETDLREKGVMILGVRRADGQQLIPPPSDTQLLVGDCLFVFGSTAAVNDMINAAEPLAEQ